MPKSNRKIKNPYIVRLRVKAMGGIDPKGEEITEYWTTISLDPALVTAAKIIYGDQGEDWRDRIKSMAGDGGHDKKSLSRAVSSEIVKDLVAAAGHDPEKFQAELDALESRYKEKPKKKVSQAKF